METKKIFNTNPQKSSNKVTINSFMMGSLFFILTLIITIDPHKFPVLVVYQLVLAIPLLYVASLAYSKVGYWSETQGWETLGWYTNTLGNLFVLNSIGLVASTFDAVLAKIYFALFAILMCVYTFINVKYHRKSWFEKLYKLIFLLMVIILGGVWGILK